MICYVQNATLSPGKYKLSVWGAQGGCIRDSSGGKGSYTEGIIDLSTITILNIYVGQQGQCNTSSLESPFFGGGLNGFATYTSCTGGGSSFITNDNTINDIIIISGSGGGSASWSTSEYVGGFGGYIAGNGKGKVSNGHIYYGTGATKFSPGKGGFYEGVDNKYSPCQADNGSFLTGGKGCVGATASSGGGGSGYYGGGGGADMGAGGGGSSWASDKLKNVIYKNGNEYIIEPDGTNNIGHSGNGFISIKPYVYCSIGNNKYCSNFNIFYTFVFILIES